MAKKGHPKNTKNKAKHAKLMSQKKAKLKAAKESHMKRIKAIIQKTQRGI